jgi:hypothetical protein
VINLIYIRAAIEANTGQRLSLERVRQLLVEEGLITPSQARDHAQIFTGYGDFFSFDAAETRATPIVDDQEGLPDEEVP